MRRLRLERIPLYQLHRPDENVPYEESVGALVELQQQGKIQHIGVSNVDERLLKTAQKLTDVASVQNRYNFGDRESETMVGVCEREGMAFLPWAPIHDIPERRLAAIASSHHATTRHVARGERRCSRTPLGSRRGALQRDVRR